MIHITIDKGDIITIIKPVYIEYAGGLYKDHFVNKKQYYVAVEMESNNGNFKVKDKNGRLLWFNHKTANIANIKKRAV